MLLALLAQARPITFPPPDNNAGAAGGIIGLVCSLIWFLVIIAVAAAVIVGMWKIFEKAGKPGWASIVPIYNLIILLEITGKPIWWIALFLIPCVNIVFAVMLWMAVAKSFGKSDAFGLGLAFLGPIFVPMLGFSDARYQGPVG